MAQASSNPECQGQWRFWSEADDGPYAIEVLKCDGCQDWWVIVREGHKTMISATVNASGEAEAIQFTINELFRHRAAVTN